MTEDTPSAPTKDPVEAALHDLQFAFALIDHESRPFRPGAVELLVYRIPNVTLRIDNSAKHGRPHFHIKYKEEHSASYAIDTCELLAGSMPKKYETEIIEWAQKHQELLYAKWKELHPGSPIYALEAKGN